MLLVLYSSSLSEKVGSGTKHLTTSVEKLVHLVPEKEKLNQTGVSNSPSRPRARSVSENDLSIRSPASDIFSNS